MDRDWRPYAAELIGTFALVYLGAGTVCSAYLALRPGQTQPDIVAVALAQGFILAAALTATLNVSAGYLNPALTFMLWTYQRLSGVKTCWLIGAQLLGAGVAGFFLRVTYTEELLTQARLGTPHLNLPAFGTSAEAIPTFATLASGVGIEFALTFILTFAIFGTMIDPRAPRLAGLGAGLAQAAAVLMAFALTGASANPARWLGTAAWEMTIPALRHRAFADHLPYWLGPILGALAAGGIYAKWLLTGADKKPDQGR